MTDMDALARAGLSGTDAASSMQALAARLADPGTVDALIALLGADAVRPALILLRG